MKKLWILLMALSLLLLCSCSFNDLTEGGSNTGKTDTAGISTHDTTNEDVESMKNITYEDVERRQTKNYKTYYYGLKNDSVLLSIKQPKDWSLEKVNGGFEITRDNKVIGSLLCKHAEDAAAWTVLKTDTHTKKDVSVTKYIEQKTGEATFRYRFVYDYSTDGDSRTVTLTAACAEIDEKCEKTLFTGVVMTNKIQSITMGKLSDTLKNPSSILILGNSFIDTSDIENILSEMLKNCGKDCEVEAIARGHALVGTYIKDEDLMRRIRMGEYDMVFICGFYAETEVANLNVLKNACDASTTELVLFPAHNEDSGVISAARSKQSSLFCLDWKSELEGLIKGGVDRGDLCINDQFGHSTPLAGYVGAHMIYRAIYNELPTEPMSSTLRQSYIDGILGDYAYVGDCRIFDEDKITYLD